MVGAPLENREAAASAPIKKPKQSMPKKVASSSSCKACFVGGATYGHDTDSPPIIPSASKKEDKASRKRRASTSGGAVGAGKAKPGEQVAVLSEADEEDAWILARVVEVSEGSGVMLTGMCKPFLLSNAYVISSTTSVRWLHR
jgi:hypothetical protein